MSAPSYRTALGQRSAGRRRVIVALLQECDARLITVFRFRYFDRLSDELAVSADYATPAAIQQMGAELMPETGKQVEERDVGHAGILLTPLSYRGEE